MFRLDLVGEHGPAKALPPGSFLSVEPGTAHYAGADEEPVVQLNSSGPWGITYLDPRDDPRTKVWQDPLAVTLHVR